jgi:hypothetical protein
MKSSKLLKRPLRSCSPNNLGLNQSLRLDFHLSTDDRKTYMTKKGDVLTEITVNSTICDFVHKIRGNKKGNKIIVDIETPCEKITKLSHMEIPMMEILDIKDNYVIDKAQEAKCCSNCLVPCGVLNLCRLESGFLAKSLAKKAGSMSIEFNDV